MKQESTTGQTVPLNKNLTYWYRATIRRIYDGDTFHCDIDLGLNHMFLHQRIRMNRINTPELKGRSRNRGLAARDYLVSILMNPDSSGKEVLLQTVKDSKGKYGRYLGEVWIFQYADTSKAMGAQEWRNVNDMMLESKHAVLLEY